MFNIQNLTTMIRKYSFLVALAILALQSCEDEAFGPVLTPGGAPTITAPAANAAFVFQENQAAQPFGVFTWTSADFGFEAGTRYTLEMDLASNNFSEPVSLGAVNSLELRGKTINDINSILINKNVAGGTPTDVQLRVKASVSDEVDALVSAPITIKITPFESTVVYPQLQVPGAYQGWAPSDNNTVIFSVGFNKKFEGYIYFPTPTEFKYTDGPAWDVNYGDDGANGTLEKNGANISAADAGMYKLNVDLDALTHTFTKATWGLIGSATPTGWNSDTDMVFDAATNSLSLTLDLIVGEIKFRANDDWGLNMGDDGANKILEYNGANIAIAEAGNYTVTLKLNGAKYRYTIQKN